MFIQRSLKTIPLFIFAALPIVFAFSQCKNDSEGYEKKIIGNWKIDSVTFLKPVDYLNDGREISGLKELSDCFTDDVLSFNKDHSYQLSHGEKKCNWDLPDELLPKHWRMDNNRELTIVTQQNKKNDNVFLYINKIDSHYMNLTAGFKENGKGSGMDMHLSRK